MPSHLITLLDAAHQPIGPFPVEEVRQRLQSGEFHPDQLAFVEGLTQWTPLSIVLGQLAAPAVPPSFVPASLTSTSFVPSNPGWSYAGFWLRLVAYFLDGLLIWAVLYIAIALLTLIGDPQHFVQTMSGKADADLTPFWIKLLFLPLVLFGPLLYFALMESSSKQATLGKMALDLKVTDLNGNRLEFWHAFGRAAAKIITNLTCILLYVGYMMAGFTARKQALHDMIAGTLVWKR